MIKYLGIAAACLAAGLIAFLVVDAFDSEVALWHFGAGGFTDAAHASPPIDIQPLQGCASLEATPCLLMTAGADLIAQHRARGGLATDRPFPSTPLNAAEACRQDLNDAPVLGHSFFAGPSDDGNVGARARPKHPGPLPRTFHLANRSSA